MDIWKYGRKNEFGADYYDNYTGYTYHLFDYGREERLGLPTKGIRVSKNNVTIGYVEEE